MDTSTSEEPIIYTWPDVVTYFVDDPDVYPRGTFRPRSGTPSQATIERSNFTIPSQLMTCPPRQRRSAHRCQHRRLRTICARQHLADPFRGESATSATWRKPSCKKHILHRDEFTHRRRAKLLHKIKAMRQRSRQAKAAWYAGPWQTRIDIKAIKKVKKKGDDKSRKHQTKKELDRFVSPALTNAPKNPSVARWVFQEISVEHRLVRFSLSYKFYIAHLVVGSTQGPCVPLCPVVSTVWVDVF